MKALPCSTGLLLIFIYSYGLAQFPRTSDYLETGVPTNLFSVIGGVNVSIDIRSRDTKIKDSDLWGGDAGPVDQVRAVRAIEDLRIKVGNSRLVVPRSAYSDLLQVRKAELSGTGGKLRLVIEGGDGGTSYTVNIEFDKSGVRRRSVSNPFVRGVVEETIYHQPFSRLTK